jgi:hypothetical protein
MIKKIRKRPIYLDQLETFIKRSNDDSSKQNLEKELVKATAGFRGEESSDYY